VRIVYSLGVAISFGDSVYRCMRAILFGVRIFIQMYVGVCPMPPREVSYADLGVGSIRVNELFPHIRQDYDPHDMKS
jgi:hypothetical protein